MYTIMRIWFLLSLLLATGDCYAPNLERKFPAPFGSSNGEPPTDVVRTVVEGHVTVLPNDGIVLVESVSGRVWTLRFKERPLDADVSGALIRASGIPTNDTLFVNMWRLLTPPFGSAGERPISAIYGMRSITYLLDICNSGHANTPSEIETIWGISPSSQPTSRTLARYMSNVSYGGWTMNASNNVVYNKIVKIPCRGATFDANKCDYAAIMAFVAAAEKAAIDDGIQAARYKHKILMMYRQDNCAWGGLGSVACVNGSPGPCYVWYNQFNPTPGLKVILHELGHNIGMPHSNRPGVEYGDASCIMGGRPNMQFYNAPQTWSAGWSFAIVDGDMNSGAYGANRWHQLLLPALATTRRNFLRIRPSITGTTSMYYVSYRIASGFDSELPSSLNNTVFVHLSDARYPLWQRPAPLLVGSIAQGSDWNGASLDGVSTGAPSFKVRFARIDGSMAVVQICWWRRSDGDGAQVCSGGV